MKELFIYKGLELEANINGYATYELIKGKVSQSKYKIALKAKKDPGIQIKSAF